MFPGFKFSVSLVTITTYIYIKFQSLQSALAAMWGGHSGIIISIIQMTKLRLRMTDWFVHGHRANSERGRIWVRISLTPTPPYDILSVPWRNMQETDKLAKSWAAPRSVMSFRNMNEKQWKENGKLMRKFLDQWRTDCSITSHIEKNSSNSKKCICSEYFMIFFFQFILTKSPI